LLGVHLAEALVAGDGEALAAGREHRLEQLARPGDRAVGNDSARHFGINLRLVLAFGRRFGLGLGFGIAAFGQPRGGGVGVGLLLRELVQLARLGAADEAGLDQVRVGHPAPRTREHDRAVGR
jgi:hypothetical protein